MGQENPYQAPKADVDARPVVTEGLETLISGHKLLSYAILMNVCSAGLKVLVARGFGLLSVVALALSLVATFRLASGMGYSRGVKILLTLAMLVPVVSLVVLLTLSSRATRRLRDAGYKIGLLGFSR
jgi:uncharacterized membrane protein YhaH (DUF805 family)